MIVDVDYEQHAKTTMLEGHLLSMLHFGLTKGGFPDWTAQIDDYIFDPAGWLIHLKTLKRLPSDY